MKITVQKYGGSSVACDEKLRRVAERLLSLHRSGRGVVAVVSAMGNTTNRLLNLAHGLNDNPPGRELDLLLSSGERISSAVLAMAIRAQGVPATALTGTQAGIHTNNTHLCARITDVDSSRVMRELSAGHIVVVAGFQGVNGRGEITTLGRGGSDTTAVALAAALQADTCDICSDVDGIYSADPHMVNDALRLPALHYDEMEALARHGAKVLNLRAVSYARKHGVTIHARSSFHENKGTLVNGKRRKRTQVIGVASLTGLIKLELGQPVTGLVRQAVELCGSDNVYIDATATGGKDLLISTLNIPDHDHLYEELKRHFDGRARLARDIGSVSIVGHGVGRSDESAMRLRSTLDDARNLQGLFSTADTRTCILDKHMVPKMVRTLHQRFVEQQPGLSAVA